MLETYLNINNLTKSYDKKVVLDQLNYRFFQGKIYGILGRNGAGKTTLFNCINNDLRYESGSITITSNDEERKPKFDDIGMVSASPLLPEFLTGYEFIYYFIKLNTEKNQSQHRTIDDYFNLVGIEENDRYKLIKNYSYGMKNKIQLLCCIIKNPKIILLDEPLSSFDIIVSHDIKELLLKMKPDHIILMATHILQLAQDISDEIVILNAGKLKTVATDQKSEPGFEEYIISLLKEDF